METAGTLSLLSPLALSDPFHFLSAVFWLRINVVNAFRITQRAANVQRKDILGVAILAELGSQFLHTASTMASWVFFL